MSDEVSQADSGRKLPEEIRRPAVLFVVNAHAAMVNMRLYPLSSSMVTDTFTKANEALDEIFEAAERLAVATVENTLLINDSRLDDVDQSKAPIKSFVAWMNERGLSNIEFRRGVSSEELQTFFSTIGNIEMEDRSRLTEELSGMGVENISVNQRVYVAVTTSETGEIIGTAQGASAPLDALKDELLMRYLTGKIDLGDIADHDLVELLSDPGKVGGLLSAFLTEEGSEGGVLMKSQKAEEALNALAELVDKIDDPVLRESMSGQITSVVAEMSPRQMTSVLTGEAPESLNLDAIRENVIKMLSDTQLLDMIDSLITEYMEMKEEAGELDTDWTRDRLRDLNELLLEVRGDRGGNIDQAIDERLEQAGIQEERDLHTGKRILSAYEMLGGPLEEEDLEMLEGVDQTIPKQIRQLYAMEELDLAAGMLLKLATNFRQDSNPVRRFAGRLLKETLEGLDEEHALVAADVLRPTLVETMESEEDFEAFRLMSESASIMTGLYMRAGRPEEASSIIGLLMEQSTDDIDKGDELKKKASETVSTMMGPDGLINAEALLLEEDEEKRHKTIQTLANMGPDALAPLVDIVKDRGAIEYRERALSALRSAGDPGVAAIINELEKENPWYIYRNILNVIAELRLVEGLPQLTRMVGSPDERIRREAVRSLARIGDPESVPFVLNAANDQSAAVRRTAVRVLGLFGSPAVAPFLVDIINGAGPRGKEEENAVVEAACLALGDLKDVSYVPQLVELIGKGGFFKKGRPDEVRAAACLALGTIGHESAVPVLERAAKDPVVMVRSSAEKALRRIQGNITAPERADEDVPAQKPEGVPHPVGVSLPPPFGGQAPAPARVPPAGPPPVGQPPEASDERQPSPPELTGGATPAEQPLQAEPGVPAGDAGQLPGPVPPEQLAGGEQGSSGRVDTRPASPGEEPEPPEPGSLESIISEWSGEESTKSAAPGEVCDDVSRDMPAEAEVEAENAEQAHAGYGSGTLEEMILESAPAERPPGDAAGAETATGLGTDAGAPPKPGGMPPGPAPVDEPDSDPLAGHTKPSRAPAVPETAGMWPEGGSLNGHDHPLPPPPLQGRVPEAPASGAPGDGTVLEDEGEGPAGAADSPERLDRQKGSGHLPPEPGPATPSEGQEPTLPSDWK